jgi:Mn-dependent DtxR family transcriptional regulator
MEVKRVKKSALWSADQAISDIANQLKVSWMTIHRLVERLKNDLNLVLADLMLSVDQL